MKMRNALGLFHRHNSFSKLLFAEKPLVQTPLWRWIEIDYARTSRYENGRWVEMSDANFSRPAFAKKDVDALCIQLKSCIESSDSEHPLEHQICPVCLEEVDEKSMLVLGCKHQMHEECLRDMVHHGHANCSVCKVPLCQGQRIDI